jgi:hypothetical protein
MQCEICKTSILLSVCSHILHLLGPDPLWVVEDLLYTTPIVGK